MLVLRTGINSSKCRNVLWDHTVIRPPRCQTFPVHSEKKIPIWNVCKLDTLTLQPATAPTVTPYWTVSVNTDSQNELLHYIESFYLVNKGNSSCKIASWRRCICCWVHRSHMSSTLGSGHGCPCSDTLGEKGRVYCVTQEESHSGQTPMCTALWQRKGAQRCGSENEHSVVTAVVVTVLI